ncbi:isoprenylcysteine carboxylmethyltransferase family protein [candidate division KSB1 bacterium]|nr:isoprenylcysteine carboxylmethyltransferase family protein [candidate division KSB1 bacterium]
MKIDRHMWSGIALTVTVVAQIVLTIVLYAKPGHTLIRNIGWVIMWISAIFGWLPMYTLRKRGGVARGSSYVHTTALVNRGLYAIVRHPQYTAGMLMAVGLALIAQHWLVYVLGIINFIICYAGTFDEDRACMAKFPGEYETYMQRVPRANFLLGMVRWMLSK